MGTQLTSGIDLRVLRLMLACCLLALAIPGSAKAAADITSQACNAQSVTMVGPPPMTIWQIQGKGQVTGLPKGVNTVSVEIRFMKQPTGGTVFSEFNRVNQTLSVNGGNASIDTGWLSLSPAPAKGDKYNVTITGTYMTGPPMMTNTLPLRFSPTIIPVP